MPPIYDLILDQDGELLIQMVEAIDASDAWRQGKSQFPYTIRGVVFNGKQLKNGSFVYPTGGTPREVFKIPRGVPTQLFLEWVWTPKKCFKNSLTARS